MPATLAARWPVTLHYLSLLRDHPALADVQVEPGWPGDEKKGELIWVDQTEGEVTFPLAMAGRKARDDHFEITFQVRVTNRASLDDTMDRLFQILAAFDDITADDPSLDDYEDVVATESLRVRCTGARTPQGYFAFAEVTLPVHLRLD